MIILHQWEMSPFCNKTRRCLAYKKLAYEVRDYNGLLARKAAALSPAGQLPVLDYEGERVQDSVRIAEFLDARHPVPPLYPHAPQALASARLWDDWAGQSLYFHEIYFRMLDPVARERGLDLICRGRPRWERAVLAFVFRRRYPTKLYWQGLARQPRPEVVKQFFSLLNAIETLLAERTWLAGDALSIADIAVAAQISELVRTSDLAPDILALPQLKQWLARVDASAPD